MSVIFNGTIKRKANGVRHELEKIKRKALNDWEERRFNQIRRLSGGWRRTKKKSELSLSP